MRGKPGMLLPAIALVALTTPTMAAGSSTIWAPVMCLPSGVPGQLMCRLVYPEDVYYTSKEKCHAAELNPSIKCMSRRIDTWSAD
jgi:hypothetical protein